MSKKDRGSFQRKRAEKIAKQKAKKLKQQRLAKRELPLEYTGRRYQTAAYVPAMMAAETGIREADELSERKMRDADVRAALARLVDQLLAGPQDVSRELSNVDPSVVSGLEPRDLVAWRILSNWKRHFADRPCLPRADLVGLLRALAHSVQIRTEMRLGGRGYLNYLEDFLAKAGVLVEAEFDDALPDADEYDDLYELGERWIEEGDPALGDQFRRDLEYRVLSGGAEDVVDICRDLMSGCPDGDKKEQLRLIAAQAMSSQANEPGRVIDVPHNGS